MRRAWRKKAAEHNSYRLMCGEVQLCSFLEIRNLHIYHRCEMKRNSALCQAEFEIENRERAVFTASRQLFQCEFRSKVN